MLGGFGWSYTIIDTGCNKSVAGKEWSNEYLAALRYKDRNKVVIKEVKDRQKFRFGGGKVFTAIEEVRAPVMIGSKLYNLCWFMVNAPIPLLWRKRVYEKSRSPL